MISVIIPNRNGGRTIARCLEAVFDSDHDDFEVVVVDDASEDESLRIIERFPCRMSRLERHGGASRARNVGARLSRGETLFFTDADCLLEKSTLRRVEKSLSSLGPGSAVGGTYTEVPVDRDFFSRFQSAFIHYCETRKAGNPDYLATHAVALNSNTFRAVGGFRENFLPILEDVEFSHRLRRCGIRLAVDPRIQVAHIFDFSLVRSLRNAMRKSDYWTLYSLGRGDLLADSGTASRGLKVNVLAFAAGLPLLLGALAGEGWTIPLLAAVCSVNLLANRGLLRSFREVGGILFALQAALYYLLVYPAAVGLGALAGICRSVRGRPMLPSGKEWDSHCLVMRAR